ncbi:V-type ATP synthase subunit K [Candidatus Sumerlaeota bacterium]|nr:V-type ATP synthase subunit K [Candidatus Sumerlaeota bacterium]
MNDIVTSGGSTLGMAFALLGAGLTLALGGVGSSIGVGLAGMTAAGVITEDPKKFGKLIPFVALPGTQGVYGLLLFFYVCRQKLLFWTSTTPVYPTMDQGFELFFVGLAAGIVLLVSAIYQGKVAAATIGVIAKKPEQLGKSLILPAFVETYAVLALVSAILILGSLKVG